MKSGLSSILVSSDLPEAFLKHSKTSYCNIQGNESVSYYAMKLGIVQGL